MFPSDGRQLHGFLWKPAGAGAGPFPAIVWNHGSEKLPGSQPTLAAFYTAHSYVFFVPHRRGQGRSPFPRDYIQDLVAQAPPGERARRMVELQEAEVDDVIAALIYLKSQPFVDPSRIAISGCSYGGIQTLLSGERDLGVKALVPFAPGAMSWEQNVPLQDRLIRAVRRVPGCTRLSASHWIPTELRKWSSVLETSMRGFHLRLKKIKH
ncbi:MAG: prolyl oligopeptidase family serine peptidase, partial [Candidatus Acidiferrales bacterium]